MSAGVYGLFYNDQCLYVGQSVSVSRRLKSHRSALKSGTHSCKELLRWMKENSLTVDQLEFTELETIEESNQASLNLLEVKYFISHSPMFHGQSPSLRNNYTKLANSPEIVNAMVETMTERVSQSSMGPPRMENGRRVWTRICLECTNVFDAIAPTGVYCSEACRITYKSFEKTCETCNKDFTAKYAKTRFCNVCRYAVHDYELNCVVCDSVFTSGRDDSKYCGYECKVKAYVELKECSSCGNQYSGFGSTRCLECRESKLWGCICADCGRSFQGSGPMSKFCSKTCGNYRNCVSCRDPFKTQASTKGRTTCSKKCSNDLKSPISSKASKEMIENLVSSGLQPREIMAKLGISKTSYYRILGS